jgi:hypothetical protein
MKKPIFDPRKMDPFSSSGRKALDQYQKEMKAWELWKKAQTKGSKLKIKKA